ncbi:hypothetical protein Ddc_15529 [Ditylenchus destructor]|nr:hypothetical protein Ddc_15529 [Ditylenchus destructor]
MCGSLFSLPKRVYGTNSGSISRWSDSESTSKWALDLYNNGKDAVVKVNKLRSSPQYLRFRQIDLRPKHWANEELRECLRQSSHCFRGCNMYIRVHSITVMEFECLLAERILPLFPYSTYFITIRKVIREDRNVQGYAPRLTALDKVSGCNSGEQTLRHPLPSNFLTVFPSILNCPLLHIWTHFEYAYTLSGELHVPLVPLDDVVQWLHHVPEAHISSNLPLDEFGKANRNLKLDACLLERHGIDFQWAEAANKLVEQIKQRFLAANTLAEKREFYLELKVVVTHPEAGVQHLAEFQIQNNATNERLTFKSTLIPGTWAADAYKYEILRSSV